ncbi:MotA/TolQ/ExbB proton channel family protein [Haliangium ochraceum]|uniref:MotA/TolQ/ExbB proton channel n=1 Tax=Haliangium ochraceum (strain DSM 14365 / JCM 11303 / SMP-2) TaxID=502025 RepID=D0LJZ6_HALO1|nr:MotA/TolQ/ExbB proton channel family protein [Haliangium ochraceum]ACY18503.1 MotA/TolQ/ExbB proton channel [Haliangium ochraceum DSM 14365]
MDMSLTEMWESMGLLVKLNTIFMLVMSIAMVYIAIERFIVYRKAATQNFSFVTALKDYLAKRRLDDARKAADRHKDSPVATVVGQGLEAYQKGREAQKEAGPDDVGDFDLVDSVNRALERVKEREVSSLRKGLNVLATVASIAPFVGLFGTVLGIINAFELLKGGGGMEVIGPGIAEALVSTAFGLLVAIPAAILFNFYTGRVETMSVDINDVSSEFMDYVLREGRS